MWLPCKVRFQDSKAPVPPIAVLAALGVVGKPLVGHHHFRRAIEGIALNHDHRFVARRPVFLPSQA